MEEAIGILTGLTQSVSEMRLPPQGEYSRAFLSGEIEAFHWEWYQRSASRYSLNQRRTIEAVHRRLNDVATTQCSTKVVDYMPAPVVNGPS